ncbi:hypothetical protein [Vibrio sp. L85]|uniref:hypothetical protein n=1 Tax=Vibrio sp. L85 TaxID=1769292 RepID=UPI0009A34F56|nr:hypothetical protein [Vibrio sp. L85]
MAKSKANNTQRRPVVLSKEKRLELIAQSLQNLDFTDARPNSITIPESLRRMTRSFECLIDA